MKKRYSIAIGIPTYKRPEMLEKLLKSINCCEIDKQLIQNIDIIIVDNDSQRSAENAVTKFKERSVLDFEVHYKSYPKKGLANVRNEILIQAEKLNPDFLVCIDDDEYATKSWLNELTKTIVNNSADIAVGPVVPEFEHEVPDYLSKWFFRKEHVNNKQLFETFGAGNLILKSSFLKSHNLTFDKRFNQTGGEDTFLAEQALNIGANIFWSSNAVVYEIIPKKRSSLKWVSLRIYRSTSTFTYILKLNKSYSRLIKKFVISFIYLITGIFGLILLPFSFKYKYWGLFKICEALGGYAGMFNIRYKEYANIN